MGNYNTENLELETINLVTSSSTDQGTQTNPTVNNQMVGSRTKNTDVIFHHQLEVIYRVMMQRILKEVSAQELSFLIGRSANYVNDVEMLTAEPYTTEDLRCIAIALKSKEIGILAASLALDKKITATMQKEFLNGICVHTCVINTENNSCVQYFSLHQSIGNTINAADSEHDYYVGLITDAISVLLAAGYFYEYRLPLKIYRSINRFLKLTMNPLLVKDVLDNFCNEAGKLTRVEDGENRFKYVRL